MFLCPLKSTLRRRSTCKCIHTNLRLIGYNMEDLGVYAHRRSSSVWGGEGERGDTEETWRQAARRTWRVADGGAARTHVRTHTRTHTAHCVSLYCPNKSQIKAKESLKFVLSVNPQINLDPVTPNSDIFWLVAQLSPVSFWPALKFKHMRSTLYA